MPRFSTLFFDLDDTLYPPSTGLWEAIRVRINGFMAERMGFSPDQIAEYRSAYLTAYGTTLRGLQIHHNVDTEDYLAYVHDLPLEEYLRPAPQLGDMIASLPQRRWIFTNADEAHALRVLRQLQMESVFDGIIDVRAVDFLSKPHAESFRKAMKIAGEPVPERCVIFDDSPRNTEAAGNLGLFTVLIGEADNHHRADVCIRELKAIKQQLPELWSSAA